MRIKASTLIESIVALTIIAIAFSAALVTFNSVTGNGTGQQKIIAHQEIQAMVAEVKRTKNYVEGNLTKNNIDFAKHIEPINDKGLIRLSITAKTEKGILLEKHEELLIDYEKD